MPLRGVILAGGSGTRLGELTRVVNKHLLPVGHQPMICHPIKKLVGAGIADIMLVSSAGHIGEFAKLLGSGQRYGCSLTYCAQEEAGGIAQALGLAKGFCGGQACVALLGDNVFEDELGPVTLEAGGHMHNATLILKVVPDADRYGVAEMAHGRIIGIEEKPAHPKSNYAITGIYIYPSDVFDIVCRLRPSQRGELEITDVNIYYLQHDRLQYHVMRGYWTDAGTYESLVLANRLVNGRTPRF